MNPPTTKNRAPRILFYALASLAVPQAVACDPADEQDADEVSDRGGGSTIKFNTTILEGVDELDTTGAVWKGVRLKGVYLACPNSAVASADPVTPRKVPVVCTNGATRKFDKVWSDKGQLRGSWNGFTLQGDAFLNSEWLIEVYNEDDTLSQHKLIIDTYDPSTFHYNFRFNGQLKTCINDLAVVLGNISVNTTNGVISNRPNTLYIACLSGAVGKAVNLGYSPSQIGVGKFTTAVRVIRADYCGDGVSWTHMGTQFQLRDIWGHNYFLPEGGADEAVWTGVSDETFAARCLSNRRLSPDPNLDPPVLCNGAPLPDCHDTSVFPTFPTGDFWTKLPP